MRPQTNIQNRVPHPGRGRASRQNVVQPTPNARRHSEPRCAKTTACLPAGTVVSPGPFLLGSKIDLAVDVPRTIIPGRIGPGIALLGSWLIKNDHIDGALQLTSPPEVAGIISRTWAQVIQRICAGLNEFDLNFIGEVNGGLTLSIFPSHGLYCLPKLTDTSLPRLWRHRSYSTLVQLLNQTCGCLDVETLRDFCECTIWDGASTDAEFAEVLAEMGEDPDNFLHYRPSEFGIGMPDFVQKPSITPIDNQIPQDGKSEPLPAELHTIIDEAEELLRTNIRPNGPNAFELDTVWLEDALDDGNHLFPLLSVLPCTFKSPAIEMLDYCFNYHMEGSCIIEHCGYQTIKTIAQLDHWVASLQLGAERLRCAQRILNWWS